MGLGTIRASFIAPNYLFYYSTNILKMWVSDTLQ